MENSSLICAKTDGSLHERIKRRIYASREEARADVFDYIEMFYNPVRRHGHNKGFSPVQFEQFSVRPVRV
jgi:putative transposase